jgi:hypothetical protein
MVWVMANSLKPGGSVAAKVNAPLAHSATAAAGATVAQQNLLILDMIFFLFVRLE